MYSRQAQVSLITDRLKVGDNARFFERPLNGLFLRRFPLLTRLTVLGFFIVVITIFYNIR
jgi:hypothetical protein